MNGVKKDIQSERADRQSSEETMLQLLEQTCNQIAQQKCVKMAALTPKTVKVLNIQRIVKPISPK